MKHGVKHQRRRKRSLPAVTMTFVLSLLAFGAAILLPWLLRKEPSAESMPTDGGEGHQRAALLLIHDTDDRLTAVVAVHTDTRKLTMTAIGYPSQTEVAYHTALSTLERRYAEEGVEVARYVSALTGATYGKVMRLSVSAVAAFVASGGNGISYTLPEEVGALPIGEQTLTSLQIADVLRYDGWMQSLTGRAEAHAGIVAAIINQRLVPQRDITTMFQRFSSLCDDTVTVAEFSVIRDELSMLAAANDGSICRPYVPEGRAVGRAEDRRFVIDGKMGRLGGK